MLLPTTGSLSGCFYLHVLVNFSQLSVPSLKPFYSVWSLRRTLTLEQFPILNTFIQLWSFSYSISISLSLMYSIIGLSDQDLSPCKINYCEHRGHVVCLNSPLYLWHLALCLLHSRYSVIICCVNWINDKLFAWWYFHALFSVFPPFLHCIVKIHVGIMGLEINPVAF